MFRLGNACRRQWSCDKLSVLKCADGHLATLSGSFGPRNHGYNGPPETACQFYPRTANCDKTATGQTSLPLSTALHGPIWLSREATAAASAKKTRAGVLWSTIITVNPKSRDGLIWRWRARAAPVTKCPAGGTCQKYAVASLGCSRHPASEVVVGMAGSVLRG